MGNYTRFEMSAKTGKRFSEIAHLFTRLALIKNKFNENGEWKNQTHPFFSLYRCNLILTSSRVNGLRETAVVLIGKTLIFNTEIKNYEDEIETFLDWISPYLDLSTVVGYLFGETWDVQWPLAIENNKIVKKPGFNPILSDETRYSGFISGVTSKPVLKVNKSSRINNLTHIFKERGYTRKQAKYLATRTSPYIGSEHYVGL